MNNVCKLYEVGQNSLVGYIETTWEDINEKFGEELAEDCRNEGSDKSYNEWCFEINGTPVCIYDYKEPRSYLSCETMLFHVGSTSIQALFELMCVGFEPTNIMTREEYVNKRFGKQV